MNPLLPRSSSRQYLLRYGQLHRIECAFDEYDGDVPENQLLAAALRAAEKRVGDLRVRNDARAFGGILREVCDAPTYDADWYTRKIRYGRRNAPYRPAHELAKLVLTGIALTDHVDRSTLEFRSFMIDMNAIFERFVTKLVVNSLAGTALQARAQQTVRAVIVDEESGQTYSTIRPDIIVEDSASGRSVPIDVKYKLYDSAKKVSTADIYQMFVYAYSVGAREDSARAALIYPALASISGPALHIKPLAAATPARIRGVGIDVAAAVEAVNGPTEPLLHAQVCAMVREITGLHSDFDTPDALRVNG